MLFHVHSSLSKHHTHWKRFFSEVALVAIVFVYISPLAYGSVLNTASIIELTNAARTKNGLSALTVNQKLSAAAQLKAEDMLANNYFDHTSPSGVAPWHWMKKAGYAYQAAGENLAINYDSAEAQQNAWMKSASHKKNILSDRYQEIGVARAEGKIHGEKVSITVVLFGAPQVGVVQQLENAVTGKEAVAPAVAEVSVGNEVTEAIPSQEAVFAANNTSGQVSGAESPVAFGFEGLLLHLGSFVLVAIGYWYYRHILSHAALVLAVEENSLSHPATA